ncbi:MAG: Crp/Fnr family transcriptional regulator [Gammaproteobacteria bacterium]
MNPEGRIDPRGNYLLAALPELDYRHLLPALEAHPLELGKRLSRPGEKMQYVYFPLASIISTIYTLRNGATSEIAVIGREGSTGTPVYMGGEATPNEIVVQHAGPSVRMHSSAFKQEFNRGGALQQIMLHYTQALMIQMSQTAVCNRHHTVEQQLCRWLLLSLDRLPVEELRMTHDLIARMLGVRREGVTRAAGNLQKQGLIAYRHGWITMLDRPGLTAAVCECYAVTKDAYQRLIHDIWKTTLEPVPALAG